MRLFECILENKHNLKQKVFWEACEFDTLEPKTWFKLLKKKTAWTMGFLNPLKTPTQKDTFKIIKISQAPRKPHLAQMTARSASPDTKRRNIKETGQFKTRSWGKSGTVFSWSGVKKHIWLFGRSTGPRAAAVAGLGWATSRKVGGKGISNWGENNLLIICLQSLSWVYRRGVGEVCIC